MSGESIMNNNQVDDQIQQLTIQETDDLVKSFRDHFDECTAACKKPNILCAGITGAGKSSLVNAVFGKEVAQSGIGMPVTQHFQKFEPKEKPVVIYDSKGLEWAEHEDFIKETGKFFQHLRNKPDVADHIHVVWYVVNTARGRIDPFEIKLIREEIAPTPVIFILNKADCADAKQIKALKKVIEDEKLSNVKGIHVCISNRDQYTQAWCPDCFSDEIFYDEETKELECDSCGFTQVLKKTYGMKKLVKETCDLLPELAKDAFMYSQQASLAEKDIRSREIVKKSVKHVSLDYKGNFIKTVAKMCSQLFVIWGWPLTADKFKDGLAEFQKEYIKQLGLKERMAMAAFDKLLQQRLSKAFGGVIGLTMNRKMKELNQGLINSAKENKMDEIDFEKMMGDDQVVDENLIKMFFETAITKGINKALDQFWDITDDEIVTLSEQMNIQNAGLLGNIDEEQLKHLDSAIQKGDEDLFEDELSKIVIQKKAEEEKKEGEQKDGEEQGGEFKFDLTELNKQMEEEAPKQPDDDDALELD